MTLEKLARRACDLMRHAAFPRSVIVLRGSDEEDGSERLELHAFGVTTNRAELKDGLLDVAFDLREDLGDTYCLVFAHAGPASDCVGEIGIDAFLASYRVEGVRPPGQWEAPTTEAPNWAPLANAA